MGKEPTVFLKSRALYNIVQIYTTNLSLWTVPLLLAVWWPYKGVAGITGNAALFSWKYVQNVMCILVGNSISLSFSIIYVCTNVIVFIVIGVAYASIIYYMRKYDKMEKSHGNFTRVLVRIGAIIITNFIPSITTTILSVLSAFPNFIPASIEANVAFILFPLNACLNPLINTLTTRQFINHRIIKSLLIVGRQCSVRIGHEIEKTWNQLRHKVSNVTSLF